MTNKLKNHLLLAQEEESIPVPVDTALLAGLDDAQETTSQDVLEDLQESSEASAEVGTAIAAVEELDGLQATLEEICSDRTPTTQELRLIAGQHSKILAQFNVEKPNYTQESIAPELVLELTKESLNESITAIRTAISGVFAKLSDALSKLWKRFVFWCKSAVSQVVQFERELASFTGDPKFTSLNLSNKLASYTGLGNGQDPAEIIVKVEDANKYVYSELYFKMAQYALSGDQVPVPNDELFNGLPNEPRFRFEAGRAFFLENPPRVKDNTVQIPSVEVLRRWCKSFIDKLLFFIRNYEAFKTVAEKVYEEIQSANTDTTNDSMLDAGKKILFARSHSCVETMEAWVYYVVRLTTAQHSTLMLARKAFV